MISPSNSNRSAKLAVSTFAFSTSTLLSSSCSLSTSTRKDSGTIAKEEIDRELGADEDKQSDSYTSYVSYTDEDGNTRGKNVCRGGYDSSSDLNNPEYICAKEILYAKLHALINELDGEELEIVQMIMDGTSEREYTKEHGIARSTFQGHKNKLLARLREALKDDYED